MLCDWNKAIDGTSTPPIEMQHNAHHSRLDSSGSWAKNEMLVFRNKTMKITWYQKQIYIFLLRREQIKPKITCGCGGGGDHEMPSLAIVCVRPSPA